MRDIQIVISSEHSGNIIPDRFRTEFLKAGKALNSHRGIDFGSSFLANEIKKAFDAPLYENNISRLLVDCNRSLHREDLFSEFTNHFDESIKKEILNQYYYPHRNGVQEYVATNHKKKMILHLSIHTFTPIWNGVERSVDIGLLFDEKRSKEVELCNYWLGDLNKLMPKMRNVFNSPYTGAEDGLTAHLRKLFTDEDYMGIEIEVNQKYADTPLMQKISEALISPLKSSINQMKAASISN